MKMIGIYTKSGIQNELNAALYFLEKLFPKITGFRFSSTIFHYQFSIN